MIARSITTSETTSKTTKASQDQSLNLPLFKLNKDKGNHPAIEINLIFNEIEFGTIHSDDIPDFYDDTFQLDEHIFHISYLLNHKDYQSGDGAYCADGRVVSFNSQMEAKKQFKAFKNHFDTTNFCNLIYLQWYI